MLYKTCTADFKVADDASGTVEAIVSVFNNVDRSGERVMPGFFAKSLANKLPKGVWMHDWTRPIAKTLEAKELQPGDALLPERLKDLGGLWVKGQLNMGVQDGKDALSHLQFGSVDEFSFGYRVSKRAYDSENDVVDLMEGEIYEWSPVLVGCNPATALLSAKDGRDLEPDDLLGRLHDALDRLGAKRLDDVQRARLAKAAPILAALSAPPLAGADDALLDLQRRALDMRASLLAPA